MILETLMMVMQNVMFVHWVNLPMDVTKVRVKFVQRGITPMTKKVMERYVKIVAKNANVPAFWVNTTMYQSNHPVKMIVVLAHTSKQTKLDVVPVRMDNGKIKMINRVARNVALERYPRMKEKKVYLHVKIA